MSSRLQLLLLLVGSLVIVLVADLSFQRLIGVQRADSRLEAEKAAELAALSVRTILGRIEEEAMRGAGSEAVSWRVAAAPSVSFGGRSSLPLAERSVVDLRELAGSQEATTSGLPVAVLAALELGDAEVAEQVGERLLGGDLPVRMEDLEGLADLLGIGDRDRLDLLRSRLEGVPKALPDYPAFERRLDGEFIAAWSRIGRDVVHYEISLDSLLERAAMLGRVHVAQEGIAVPDLPALRIAVDPDRKGVRSLWALRGLVWLAMLCVLVGLLGFARAQRLEREALERERALLASVSHELRNPLASIKLFGESLAEGQGNATEYGQLIAGESERLERMIDRILTAARTLEAAALEEVDPGILARSAVDRVRSLARRQNVLLVVEIEEDLATCVWDREAVHGALVNLLDNAIRHGGSEREVALRASSEERAIRLSVRDEGQGIGSSDQRKLFERFRRGESRAAGSGLGLYLVEQVAKAHGGSVTLESEIGKGSVFHLVLPVKVVQVSEERRS